MKGCINQPYHYNAWEYLQSTILRKNNYIHYLRNGVLVAVVSFVYKNPINHMVFKYSSYVWVLIKGAYTADSKWLN